MKHLTHHINITYQHIDSLEALSEQDRRLFDAALRAADKAYAPYSGFQVGAAVLMEGGIIISGCNQENAAYPSGLCAERVAVFAASSDYPDRVMERIVIVSKNSSGELRPVTPCGSCRQVLYEYECRQELPISILVPGESGTLLEFKDVKSLLPFGFNKNQMD